eukprot:CAMPEP_0206036518 /NCGR_PEP_ID=MMETSP1466-20131121/2827_1 /ASSEMBLY_ACC=CAM_ASM_001126 /TAXON_ID=44452 /ORGANISM="Pavlova gyrans, Strain CCMP608" /LENGTH=57 /DNA_ID=CAMNT_0053410999 /DNA_START=504 /DNA_END=674 /DNA_ORIENTATION=-
MTTVKAGGHGRVDATQLADEERHLRVRLLQFRVLVDDELPGARARLAFAQEHAHLPN